MPRSLLLVLTVLPALLAAQHEHGQHPDSGRFALGGMGTGVYSRANPGPLKTIISEAYLTQPMLVATWRPLRQRLVVYSTLNAEGATLDRGEINPGVYGEGYVDRRHPHTWLHELMVGTRGAVGPARWILFAGKGFVPYGTDDPMVRPLVKYPVNHHHAQILERAMITGSLTWRGVLVEAARFNGDEPESTTDWPNMDRALDSWATRVTLRPVNGLELSGSIARVESPEFAAGFGLDQRKESASVRYATQGDRRTRYVLIEYARTREYSGAVQAFNFDTWLGEGSAAIAGGWTVAARVERTIRPEEERTDSFFRTVRPMHDFNIIGRTRWTNASVHAIHEGASWKSVRGRPFLELGYHVPRATQRPTALDPVELFGARSIWMMSAGFRFHVGTMRSRFGRYTEEH